MEKIFNNLIEKVDKLQLHLLFLSFGLILVVFSFPYEKYFFGTFSFFILGVCIALIQLTRKREGASGDEAYGLGVLLVVLMLVWIIINIYWLFIHFF